MAWTYAGDPAAQPRDAVRFLVGDTDAADPLASDEEIAWALARHGTATAAAAAVARAIAAGFARSVQRSVGDLGVNLAQRHAHYLALADRLAAEDRRAGAMPYAGGLSRADKQGARADADRVRPAFRLGVHDAGPAAPAPTAAWDE